MATGIERYLAERDLRVDPLMNVYDASRIILENKASGATVVNDQGEMVGVL